MLLTHYMVVMGLHCIVMPLCSIALYLKVLVTFPVRIKVLETHFQYNSKPSQSRDESMPEIELQKFHQGSIT